MIEIDGVSLTYEQENTTVNVLQDVSFQVGDGENWIIIGPSGCGKSSLLFLLAGLLKPTKGKITVHNQPINGPRASTALILQDYGLFPWKTVWHNVALGLKIRGMSKEEQRARIEPIMAELGLEDYQHHYPTQLSGGQRQRVAVARALAQSPDLLLMDEPFSALDALTRENLQNLVLKIWQERKLTMLMVTHSIEEAVFLGRKIVVFTPHPARVIEVIDNPNVGDATYRATAEFYQCCAKVRRTLELGQ